MDCTGASSCTCGCCSGTSVQTPQLEGNRPGLNTLAYRAGAWATFKESMLARLSSSDYPALQALKTRADDDFTVAFLDATSIVLDILTFYQERLVNESYLRTATQVRSLTELSRLIGYQPAPGVAASTYLAFSLKQAPGQPANPAALPIAIPQGTQAQSVPAQSQKPQTFETSADIPAKPDWNTLAVQTGIPWVPPGSSGIYLQGTATQLQLGDSLLILGVARELWNPGSTPNEQWDVVVVNQVQVDQVRKLTYVSWDKRLSHGSGTGTSGDPSSWTSARVFALRQKAALFGHNAPNPNLFVSASHINQTSLPNLIGTSPPPWHWIKYAIGANNTAHPPSSQIDLDAPYPKIVVNSWFVLTLHGVAQLYKVIAANAVSLSYYALSGKVTELAADFDDAGITAFSLPQTEVWAQSEQLAVAEQPLNYPLYGSFLDLEGLRPDLAGVTAVALSGKRQKVAVNAGVTGLSFYPGDGSASMNLKPGDLLTLLDPSALPLNPDGSVALAGWNPGGGLRTLNVSDASGRLGTVSAPLNDFSLLPAGASDPQVTEYALVAAVNTVANPYPHTCIQLGSSLTNCYDRTATTVNANAGLATAGQSVTEVMGSGNASSINQSFTLRQSPLTYIQSATPTGMQSTLEVRVNGVAWQAAPTLYQQAPTAQVFATLNESDGTTDVQFGGDGEGSLLPTGQNNLIANYRIGSGSAGNVAAGSITTLMDRPLGVSGVTNPQNATGGQDPQSISDIRTNAPQTVLTLGRAVSIVDYQNYAATFSGISKAYAIWIPSGPCRGVFITVAGVAGAALPGANPTITNLVTSLQDSGDPLAPITIASYVETLFKFTASVQYDSSYDQHSVQARVTQTLIQTFSFAARSFGQAVSIDEVATTIQRIAGVVAVNVTGLQRTSSSTGGDLANLRGFSTISELNQWMAQAITLNRPFADSPNLLCAYLPVANPKSPPQPAEILVIDPRPGAVILGVLS
jgi:Baseplate J-like protein